MKKKWEGNRRKRFYSERWGNAVWRGVLVKIPSNFPCMTVLWKLLNAFG